MKEVCNAELKRRFDQVEFLTRDPFGMSRNLCLELQFGECTDLNLSSRDISSSHMSEFSSAVASGALASLEELDLNDNQICEEGMKLFFTAVSSGALASLTFLRLDENQIGDTGMIAFADAIKPTGESPMGALANLTTLWLYSNQIGDEGMQAFSSAISSGTPWGFRQ